jgi:hypothetical protein
MNISVYFRDGEYLYWSSLGNEQPNDEWYSFMKTWMPAVAEDSYAWATAALGGREEWSYQGEILPYHPINVLPDNDLTISTLDVDAVYVFDEDQNIIMYYIQGDAVQSRIDPQHYVNRGRVMDLRCPLLSMLTDYEYHKKTSGDTLDLIIKHPDKEYKKYFQKLYSNLKNQGGEIKTLRSKKHLRFEIRLNEKIKRFSCSKSGEINSLKNVINSVDKFLLEAAE